MRNASKIVLALCIALLGSRCAAQTNFIAKAKLSGANEVPSVTSPATGIAVFQFDSTADDILYRIHYQNLIGDGTACFVGLGLPFTDGPSILNCERPSGKSGDLSGTLTLRNLFPNPAHGIATFDDAAKAMQGGKTYLNLYSSAFPGGEIRGQLTVVPESGTFATLAIFIAVAAGSMLLRRRRSIS